MPSHIGRLAIPASPATLSPHPPGRPQPLGTTTGLARRLMLLALPALLAVFGMAAPPAEATTRSFRCNNDLVNLGDSKASALLKCGQPVVSDSFCKAPEPSAPVQLPPGRKVIINAPCETVDELTYNPGYGQFITTLRFESGRLVRISYGDRAR